MGRPKTIGTGAPRLWQLLRRFLPGLRREGTLVGGSMMALFASVLFQLLEPWPLKVVVDRLTQPERPEAGSGLPSLDGVSSTTLLALAAMGLVLIVTMRAICDYYKTIGFALIGNRVITTLRADLYRHLQSLSLSFHDKARGGDLLVRVVGDMKLLRDVVVTAFLPLLGSVLILAGMITIMLLLHWRLALLSLLILPLFGFSTLRLGKRIHEAARKQRQREGAIAATASEAINSVKVVQALSLEDHFESTFSTQNRKSLADSVKTRKMAARLERTADILIAAATAAVLWYGAHLVLAGQLSLGILIVFLTYLKRGFRPLQDFAKYAGRLAKATAAGERIVELLDIEPDVQDAPDAVPAPRFSGAVRFAHVHFNHDGRPPLFADLNLEILSGERVVIVGPSGAGKSTIISLLLRLYDPSDGTIRIDGDDIRKWTLASLRPQISVVLQDTVLFSGDVYDNIALGADDVDSATVVTAAKLANAHDFIEALPNGYDTMLGERGANLSHGQRQRIAIARAAVRDAPILLLDEPTTGLDQVNEKEVRESLRRLAASRTTIYVTHDLRDVSAADRVIYLDAGCVKEQGTHRHLLQRGNGYAQLYRSQMTGAADQRELPAHVDTT